MKYLDWKTQTKNGKN